MVIRRGISGPAFPGVITSSISLWDNMGLMMSIPEVAAERNIAATN
jgi:hypothetical protein